MRLLIGTDHRATRCRRSDSLPYTFSYRTPYRHLPYLCCTAACGYPKARAPASCMPRGPWDPQSSGHSIPVELFEASARARRWYTIRTLCQRAGPATDSLMRRSSQPRAEVATDIPHHTTYILRRSAATVPQRESVSGASGADDSANALMHAASGRGLDCVPCEDEVRERRSPSPCAHI